MEAVAQNGAVEKHSTLPSGGKCYAIIRTDFMAVWLLFRPSVSVDWLRAPVPCAQEHLGWSPTIAIDEEIVRLVDWHRGNRG